MRKFGCCGARGEKVRVRRCEGRESSGEAMREVREFWWGEARGEKVLVGRVGKVGRAELEIGSAALVR